MSNKRITLSDSNEVINFGPDHSSEKHWSDGKFIFYKVNTNWERSTLFANGFKSVNKANGFEKTDDDLMWSEDNSDMRVIAKRIRTGG